jgi:hypothetical protein
VPAGRGPSRLVSSFKKATTCVAAWSPAFTTLILYPPPGTGVHPPMVRQTRLAYASVIALTITDRTAALAATQAAAHSLT